MSELWPHWARMGWFAAWPVMAWLCWALWLRRRRAGRWQALLPRGFHATLLRGGQGRAEHWPRLLLGAAALLAALALAGPGWQQDQQVTPRPNDPLVIMLQLTPSMLAKDVSPNRLSQARRKILDLLQRRGDAQTAIVVYAGSAHTLVPLSDDQATISNLLAALKPSLMPEPGQRADLAVRQALSLLAQAGQGPGRLLLIASSVNDAERDGMLHWLGRHGPPLSVLGVGSPEGAPVTLEDGELLKGADGAILVPRLSADGLDRLASQARGHYQTAVLGNHDLRALGLLDTPRGAFTGDTSQGQATDRWADQGYWLLLPLLAIAALAGRRGWLLCLPLLLVVGGLPRPAYAFELSDLWWRPDQQGQRLLVEGKPALAAQHFTHYQWQGIALYRAGQYAEAAKRFAQGDSAADHYNRGNALAQSGALEPAIQAYEQALERDPALDAARRNRALVQHLLEARTAEQAVTTTAPLTADEASAQPLPQGQRTGESEQTNAAGGPSATSGAGGAATASTATTPATPGTGDGAADVPASDADGGSELNEAPDDEQRDSLEQWLRQIPDDPSELLRRKFLYEQLQRQEPTP
jgi:Ca-activated chloride channel family protein